MVKNPTSVACVSKAVGAEQTCKDQQPIRGSTSSDVPKLGNFLRGTLTCNVVDARACNTTSQPERYHFCDIGIKR